MEEPASKCACFAFSSDFQRCGLVSDAVPANSKQANNTWVTVLQDYAKATVVELIQFNTVSDETLGNFLEGFYVDARTRTGEKCQRNSLLAARGAINLHVKNFHPEMNVFSGTVFLKANQVFDKVLEQKKWFCKEPSGNHKQALSDGDLEKLDHYFAEVLPVPDPRKLSFFVWYTVTTHFGLCGGELQAKLRKSDLIFSNMGDKEVIHLATNFMKKNHGAWWSQWYLIHNNRLHLQWPPNICSEEVPQRSSSKVWLLVSAGEDKSGYATFCWYCMLVYM